MFQRRRMILAGTAAALAIVAASCSSTGAPSRAAGGSAGTATVAELAGDIPNWIFPFYSFAYDNSFTISGFQWLMYRPLYMFGGNSNNSVTINYPLSVADPPVYTNGGKTVTVTMKGWKWSDGEPVNADDVVFFLNMTEAEKAAWYAYSAGLLPDNVVSYRATGPDTLVMQLNRPYSSLWYTYNQLAELNPMPLAWDVTKLGAKPGSGGCTTDTAADGWAKCKAVYAFLTGQSNHAGTYATSPLWSVVDGPWKLSSFNTNGNVTMVPNRAYSGSPKPRLSAVKFLPFTDDTTEYTALKTGQVDVGYIPPQDLPPKPANAVLPSADPLGSGYYMEPFYSFGIQYVQPDFNNPQAGYLFRQLYFRQAVQYAIDQPGIDDAIFRGYSVPTSGPIPTATSSQWIPPIQQENDGQGPYRYDPGKAKALLISHGWTEVGGIMTCQDPAKCGTGITKGQQPKFTILFATGQASVTAMAQAIKSEESQVGIDVTLVGQTYNTISAESAPCAPMGPKCSMQAVFNGGWIYNGPGYEPTGEPLFQTGAASNAANYSDPTMDKLISETHTSSSLAVFHQYATYTALQLPYIWVPEPYAVQAVSSRLRSVTFSPLDTLLPEYWYFTK